MNNKIKKIDSTKLPKPARSYGGPATAGVEYDVGRQALVITPDAAYVKNPTRRVFPDIWTESVVLPDTDAANASRYGVFWTAPYGVTITGVTVRYVSAGSSSTVDLKKVPSGTALNSGTSLLTSPISTSNAANNQTNIAGTLITNPTLNAGDSLGITPGGTLTGLGSLVVTVAMRRTPDVP